MPKGRRLLIRLPIWLRAGWFSGKVARRFGTDHGCFLSSVSTSTPRDVEMAREEWKRLIL